MIALIWVACIVVGVLLSVPVIRSLRSHARWIERQNRRNPRGWSG